MSRASSGSLTVVSRRAFLLGAGAAATAGCMGPASLAYRPQVETPAVPPPPPLEINAEFASLYEGIDDDPFFVDPVDVSAVETRFLRQQIMYDGDEEPGTIVVDPDPRYLYFILDDVTAMRYGVGVGREGFGWTGQARVGRKARWPTWTPPRSMIEREPELAQYAGGVEPGPLNPLGARALYLFRNGEDTLYRLHGTNEPESIGQAKSSGCIRMFNHDAIDLYKRAKVGTRVVVRPHGTSFAA